MNSHDLAKKLLSLPDLPVCLRTIDADFFIGADPEVGNTTVDDVTDAGNLTQTLVPSIILCSDEPADDY